MGWCDEEVVKKLNKRIGEHEQHYCQKAKETTSWSISHATESAGTGIAGHWWHKWVRTCDHCGLKETIYECKKRN